jgi:hypothetical protein
LIPPDFSEKIYDFFYEIKDNNQSCIIVPTHKKSYFSGSFSQTKEIKRNLFSHRFRGINAYLLKYKKDDISKFIESVRFEWDEYSESKNNYILLPYNNTKLKICDKNDIYFEVVVQETQSDDQNAITKILTKSSDKTYIYKLTKHGKGQTDIIEKFISNCIEEYKAETQNKKEHSAFEYMKSQKDEDDKIQMVYTKTPFKSNKFLDKNIFYERKQEIIDYIDRFAKPSDGILIKNKYELEYEMSGVTFKAAILLEGPPGCGKSATIKGIANRTGRHLVLVNWSKIESCSEFVQIFRNTTINDITYTLRELLFVFEDFDANSNQVLKSRKDDQDSDSNDFNIIPSPIDICLDSINGDGTGGEGDPEVTEEITGKESDLIKKYKRTLKRMKQALTMMTKKNNDELTLECVLNTLDGIMELHDAMMVFTTNHIENIDEAFLRPGRIDKIVHLTKASVNTIKEMIKHKFILGEDDLNQYKEQFDNMKDFVLSPAEVQNITFQYSKGDIEKCLAAILAKMG